MRKAEPNEQLGLRIGSMRVSYNESVLSGGALKQAVIERYRCPADLLNLEVRPLASAQTGYFRFGSGITCYGRSSKVSAEAGSDGALFDALQEVTLDGSKVNLPFDPAEVIDNLRLERYQRANGNGDVSALRKLYYFLRPLTGISLRRQIQKFHARGWQKSTFPAWPVDTTVESLCEKVLQLSMQAQGAAVPFVWFWPEGAPGCALMTHDVETERGRDFCSELMDLDDSFGIKASFQIVPEERYAVSRAFLSSIRQRGFEVCVQDLNHDGRLFDSKDEFLRRAARINQYGREYGATAFRAAVLYRNPEWYEALDFAVDMSIPNSAPMDPQRGGCCTVMPYFIGKTLELPVTTIQDYTLFHLLEERSIALWKTQIEMILKKHGIASFIVHPDYLLTAETRSLYAELLGYLRELRASSGIWCTLPSELDGWWRARSRMTLVRDGSSWRIEGEGAERARLAYAKDVNGQVVYEIPQAASASILSFRLPGWQ